MKESIFMSQQEVGDLLARKAKWVQKHSRVGAIPLVPSVKVLNRYRYERAAILEFVAANTAKD